MARPNKIGLDYFPLDVDIEGNDKIQLIEAEFGLKGFGVIIKLFCKIYKDKGYYYNWTEREMLLFAKRTGESVGLVDSIVKRSVKWGLFNESLFNQFQILTSVEIQERFLGAAKRREKVDFIKEYILFDVSAYINLINVCNNSINADIGTQSKVKESKEEKNPPTPQGGTPPIDYQKLISIYHEKCPNMPRVEILNEQRKKAIRARVNEHGKNKVVEMFTKAGSSKFLNGDNDKNWVATFDWLFNPKNFVKTIEGNYEKSSTGKKSLQIGQILQQDGYKPKVNF